MRTISIANQKGGCGKTTTAINLSSALAISGRRVLLIDLDPQAHASFGLGVTSQLVDKSIYNVLTDNPDKKCSIKECITNADKDLDLTPSNILLSTLEQELKDKEDAVSRLYQAISEGDLKYDYIIIDCPPSLGFLTFNALRAADLILVPIDMSAFSLMGVAKLLGMLELIKVKIGHAPGVNSLATIFDKRTKYSQTMLDEIKSLFKDQMLETIIRMNVALKKAASQGVSVIQFDKKSNGAIDYMALAKELIKTEKEPPMAKEPPVQAESTQEKAVQTEVAVETEKAIMALTSAPIDSENSSVAADVATGQTLSETMQSLLKGVVFAINAPAAKEIYLVGDFNQWKATDEARLARLNDGRWEKKLELPSGRYKYKFIVDGQWVLDSQNLEREQNIFGTADSVIKL